MPKQKRTPRPTKKDKAAIASLLDGYVRAPKPATKEEREQAKADLLALFD